VSAWLHKGTQKVHGELARSEVFEVMVPKLETAPPPAPKPPVVPEPPSTPPAGTTEWAKGVELRLKAVEVKATETNERVVEVARSIALIMDLLEALTDRIAGIFK